MPINTDGNRVFRKAVANLAVKEAVMTKLADVVEATAIRPFQVNVPEAELTDLRRRIVATRLPERETVTFISSTHARAMRAGSQP
jgi:hypothetical protein